MSEIDKFVSDHGRNLGITGRRLVQPDDPEVRAKRKAERLAAKQKAKTPLLNPDADIEDEDVEAAIESIKTVPTAESRAEEADALESILRAMRGES